MQIKCLKTEWERTTKPHTIEFVRWEHRTNERRKGKKMAKNCANQVANRSNNNDNHTINTVQCVFQTDTHTPENEAQRIDES